MKKMVLGKNSRFSCLFVLLGRGMGRLVLLKNVGTLDFFTFDVRFAHILSTI